MQNLFFSKSACLLCMAMGQKDSLGAMNCSNNFIFLLFFPFWKGLNNKSVYFLHANHNVFVVGYGSWFEHVQEFWEHHMDANVLFLKYEDMHKVGQMKQKEALITFIDS